MKNYKPDINELKKRTLYYKETRDTILLQLKKYLSIKILMMEMDELSVPGVLNLSRKTIDGISGKLVLDEETLSLSVYYKFKDFPGIKLIEDIPLDQLFLLLRDHSNIFPNFNFMELYDISINIKLEYLNFWKSEGKYFLNRRTESLGFFNNSYSEILIKNIEVFKSQVKFEFQNDTFIRQDITEYNDLDIYKFINKIIEEYEKYDWSNCGKISSIKINGRA